VMLALDTPGKCRDRKRLFRASGRDPSQLAKTTTDPKVSAALIDKAADLKSQVNETGDRDLTPLAPDVEPPAA